MIKKSLVVSFLCFFLISSMTFAHPGGKDELGGHFRKSDCVYLLHESTSLAKQANNIQELISLIQQNNSSECVNNLSVNTIDLEGYTLSGASSSQTTAPVPAQNTSGLQMGKTYPATLEKCVDGDTANFIINGKEYKTRFLYIDTPESTTQHEPYGNEASDFTCNFLKQGSITLETDGGDVYDKYDRLLAWVFVDGKLHQEVITKAGFVEDFYDYGTYKYENRIINAMDEAKSSYKGIYASLQPNKPVELPKPESSQPIEQPVNTSEKPETKEEPLKEPIKIETTQDKEQAEDKSESKEETSKEDSDGSVFGWIVGFVVIVLIGKKLFG